MRADDPERPPRRHGQRRPLTGAATGALTRPRSPQRRQVPRKAERRPPRSRSSRYGEGRVASLGEARAYRQLRSEQLASRTRARRQIKTTRPFLGNRFGAGRPRARLIWTLIILVLVLCGVLAKVGLMQGMGGEVLRAEAAELWTRNRQLPAQRGTIFDRNGDELALSVPGATIAVNPRQVLDAAGTVDTLGTLLNLSDDRRAALLTEMQTCDCGFLYVARQADPRIGGQISDLGLVGVTVYDEDRRMTPGGSTGRSVIGKTDIDGIGTAGLERQYHGLLQGSPGEMTLEVAPNGRAIAGTGEVVQPATPGSDIITTIDRSVQYQAEQVLVQQVNITGRSRWPDHRHGHRHRRHHRHGVRRPQRAARPRGQRRQLRRGRGLRARLRRQGDHARRGDRGGHRHARHDVRLHPVGLRLHDRRRRHAPRLPPARPVVADDSGHPRRVVERRHDPRQQDDRLRTPRPLHARVRPRRAHRPGIPGRVARHPQAVERLDRHGTLHGRLRPGCVVDADPARQRGQRDRQRRNVRSSSAGVGNGRS